MVAANVIARAGVGEAIPERKVNKNLGESIALIQKSSVKLVGFTSELVSFGGEKCFCPKPVIVQQIF